MGAPNAGKSVLVNTLLDNKVSAVSPRANTTRDAVLGVLTEGDTQMILVDTPGIMADKNVHRYTRQLVKTAWEASLECDVAVLLVDASAPNAPGRTERELLRKFNRLAEDRPDIALALALNKVDAVSPKERLLPMIEEMNNEVFFDETFLISALEADGTDDVKEYLFSKAVPRDWEYHEHVTTDLSLLDRLQEILREQLFLRLGQEVPYFVEQRNVGWTEDATQDRLIIDHDILVPRSSQVGIVIGPRGEGIKAICDQATIEFERIVRRPVLLRLRVRAQDQQ
eukprot:TRINITY_DN2097_c0_g1_i2.p2 TRINITY_DN2097_c0_g1~~TRINITY_DN2097_c0_g1_i2.p2  ORF type:complete len:283 (+),score=160.68 TRINITY_DN2097_c0_g1_i2:326-1174(+)